MLAQINKYSKREEDIKKITLKKKIGVNFSRVTIVESLRFFRPQSYLNYHIDKHRNGNFLAFLYPFAKIKISLNLTSLIGSPSRF